jgi:hypothetical protein
MDEISRPMKTMSSSTEEVMNIMPVAPKQMRAKYSPAWVMGDSKKSKDPSSVTSTMDAMSRWKKTEKLSTWMVP